MEISTSSGNIVVNKRSPYGKWLIGYVNGGGWSGAYTLSQMWNNHKDKKPNGCSWMAWGEMCAWLYWNHYRVIDEYKNN